MKIIRANTIEQQLFKAGDTKAITLMSDFEHEDGTKPDNTRRMLEVRTYKRMTNGWMTVVSLCWMADDQQTYQRFAMQYQHTVIHPEIKRATEKSVNAAHLKVLANQKQFFIDMEKPMK